MTKRTATKLFTVVALAAAAPAAADTTKPIATRQAEQPRTLPSGAPACGNVMTKGGSVRRCQATAPAPKPEPAKPAPIQVVQARSTLQKILAIFNGGNTPPRAARPRQLRNGSPANGNVQGRMVSRPEVEPVVEAPTGPRTQN